MAVLIQRNGVSFHSTTLRQVNFLGNSCGGPTQSTFHFIMLFPEISSVHLTLLVSFFSTIFDLGRGELSSFRSLMISHHVPITKKRTGNNDDMSRASF